ncbi:MAG TPA: energy transducer TonB [Opitutus sp.]|nr:energy transducer TonB [Opitutus sp.]
MNAVNKLVVLISVSALLPLAASAKSGEQAYLETSARNAGGPVPVAVVTPSVSAEYAGSQVNLAFTVDATGKPTEMRVVSSPDAMVARVIMDAVKKWRFKPAEKNGTAVSTKVVLPVRINEAEKFATN